MTDKMELLRDTRLFVLDMDGTFYLGDRILPGAADFLKAVKAAGKDYLFFTNNSSRSPRDYMAKLAGMGCPITRDQIMTSGDVTIRYLQTHYPDKNGLSGGHAASGGKFCSGRHPSGGKGPGYRGHRL